MSIQSVLYIKQQRASFCVFEQAEIANTALQDIQLTAAKAKSISVRTAEIIATMSSATVFNRLYDKYVEQADQWGISEPTKCQGFDEHREDWMMEQTQHSIL